MVPRTLHVVGLDLSLASTGVAVLGYTPDKRWTTHTFTVPTAGRNTDTEPELLDRMDYVVNTIIGPCEYADAIAVERPAFAARGNAVATVFGLWWLAYRRLMRLEIPVVIIAATSLKKYATGSGRAEKRDISRATARMFPDTHTGSGDEDDALVLAAMGADMADLPVPYERTQYRRTTIANVARPDDWEPLA